MQELQQQLEEEQRKREECRELFLNAERQLSLLLAERQELEIQREQLDAHKRRTEEELAEHTANRQLLQGENLQLTAARRAVENDTHIMKVRYGCELYEYEMKVEAERGLFFLIFWRWFSYIEKRWAWKH